MSIHLSKNFHLFYHALRGAGKNSHCKCFADKKSVKKQKNYHFYNKLCRKTIQKSEKKLKNFRDRPDCLQQTFIAINDLHILKKMIQYLLA